MNLRKIGISCCVLALFAVSLCTKVDYTNPIDSKGTAYLGDSASADDNHDGIANRYDPTSAYYKNHNTEFIKHSTPSITLIGGTPSGADTVIIEKNDPKHILGTLSYSASDPLYGDLTASVVVGGDEIFTSTSKTYTQQYSVINVANDTAKKSRVVIIDGVFPEITLAGENPMSLSVGATYTEPGYTASDNVDGVVTANVTKTNTVNTAQQGIDSVMYSVSDRAGNKTTVYRVVVITKSDVVDNSAPIITLKGSASMSLKVGDPAFVDPGFSAYDSIDGDVTDKVIKTGSVVNTAVAGTYTFYYNVSDKAGNPAVQKIRTVVVSASVIPGDSLPVITLKGPNPDSVMVGTPFVDPGVDVMDKKDGVIPFSKVVVTGITGQPITVLTTAPAIYTLAYNVKDADGNAAITITRTVIVYTLSNDKTPPSITLIGAASCTVSVGKTYTDPGATANDDVDNSSVITAKIKAVLTTAAGAAASMTTFTNTIGSYKITYNVSDAAGNPAIPKIRSILVQDTTGMGANLLIKYGVPLGAGLPSVSNITYKTITVDGTGAPSMAGVTNFALNWDSGNKSLYGFSLSYTASPYYVSFTSMAQTLAQASPGFTLTGSGVSGLDGSYYIKADATQCVWVEKTGKFAIIFKP